MALYGQTYSDWMGNQIAKANRPHSKKSEAKPTTKPQPTASQFPEWLRVDDAARASGLSRSLIYELIQDGSIVSASIKRRNALRGCRLISRDSLMAFIEKHVETKPSAD